MIKYIFPIALIVIDLCAALCSALEADFKMTAYWIAAAVINYCVTF